MMTQSERMRATAPTHAQPLPRLSRPRLDAADIAVARQRHTLVDLLACHGITVVGSGPRRTARCPFHDDQSPSLSVYLDSNRYYCFACGASGDAISLLQRLDGLDFREAVARLSHSAETSIAPDAQPDVGYGANVMPRDPTRSADVPDAQETLFQEPSGEAAHRVHAHAEPQTVELLSVAAALYQVALATSQEASAYLRARRITEETARHMHVGYGRPGVLRDFLGDDPTVMARARAVGLLDAVGKERLASRIIIPELREGRCLWMVGRTLSAPDAPGSPDHLEHPLPTPPFRAEAPKYLGVTAPKPLMGIGAVRAAEPSVARPVEHTSQSRQTQMSLGTTGVIVVEGPFDLLAAQQWRLPLPCVALVGAHASRQQLLELMAFAAGRPIWLALDADPAGDAGAEHLRAALISARYAGPIYRLRPPVDAKDFGDIAGRLDARAALLRLLAHPEQCAMIPAGASGSAARDTTRKHAAEGSS